MAAAAGTIVLKPQEGEDEACPCPLPVASQMGVVVSFFGADGGELKPEDMEKGASFECPAVAASDLRLVIEFVTRNLENPVTKIDTPVKTPKLEENEVPKWAADWMEAKSTDEVFNLLEAADYLQIPTLLDLAAACIACKLKAMPEAVCSATFAISRDFTPEEEEMIREEGKWADEN